MAERERGKQRLTRKHIAEELKERWIDWKRMELIVPVNTIASQYGVDPMTVRRALRYLGLVADWRLRLHPVEPNPSKGGRKHA